MLSIKNVISFSLLSTLSLLASTVFAQTTLLKNIQGYTHNGNEIVQFSAIQFSDDKVDKLFNKGDALPSQNMVVIDGQNKTLIPGLIDAHGHVLNYGFSLLTADLVGTKSERAAVDNVRKYVKKSVQDKQQLSWIHGRGWNQVQWPSKQYPSAKSLDKYFPDTPVVLSRIDGHAIWVNSKAMQIAGVDTLTADIPGGQIVKDTKGNPSGVFVDNAMALIFESIPDFSVEETENILTVAMQSLAEVGLTSVHDAGIDSTNIDAFKQLAKENNMPIRINAMVSIDDKNIDGILKQGHFTADNQMLTINSVKISADGALGSRGAALIKDYSDLPGHKGLLLYDEPTLYSLMKKAMQAGFQVNTHAIGDNANKLVIDNYETLIKSTNTKHLRHRVEHAQVLRLIDIPRFKELGIIASMQATHATSDKNMAESRVGKDRIKGAYAWRSLINAGAVIAAGSDFPVEYPNPFYGLHASVTRQDKQNQPKSGWYSNEAMTLAEAFKSFTLDAAYAGHQEKEIGSLEANKKADFILLDQNIFTISAENIWKTKVLQTWVNGKQVH